MIPKAVDQALRDLQDTQGLPFFYFCHFFFFPFFSVFISITDYIISGPLISKSRAAAAQLPTASKQRVLDALADLDALLPQQQNAARELAQNPRDSTKKNKLDAVNKQIAQKTWTQLMTRWAAQGPSRASTDEPDKVRKKTQKSKC